MRLVLATSAFCPTQGGVTPPWPPSAETTLGHQAAAMRPQNVTKAIRDRPWLADALLGFALLLGGAVADAAASPTPAFTHWSLSTVAWNVAGVIPIALRRARPRLAVVVVLVYSCVPPLVPALSEMSSGDGGVPLLIVAYTVATQAQLRSALGTTVALWGCSLATGSYIVLTTPPESQVPAGTNRRNTVVIRVRSGTNAMIAMMVYLMGRNVATRRAYTAAMEDRARAAEDNQRALAVQAVAEERRRVAQELHDVVAHHISVMSVLASGARRTLAQDPAAVKETLATIEQTGRSVLREMRRLLSVMRTDELDGDTQLDPSRAWPTSPP